jgi:predicted NUDIX family NTP pyrophosphohydrolase
VSAVTLPSWARRPACAPSFPYARVVSKLSAGILLFRRGDDRSVEVLIAHPGGPLWAAKDVGAWSIPKGEADDGETEPDELLGVARREFEEETGHASPDGRAIALGEVRLKSGKVIHGWALEGDLDPATATSTTFELEWPPRSGRRRVYPEVDRVAWVTPTEAAERLNPAQAAFIERLLRTLAPEG